MQRIEEALGNNCWILLWISKEKKEACRGLLCISLATFGKEIQLGYLWICICFRNIVPFLSTLDTCRHILKFAIPQWIKWNCGEYLNEPYPLLGKRFITWLHTYLFLIWLFLSWVCTCVCVCVCVCVFVLDSPRPQFSWGRISVSYWYLTIFFPFWWLHRGVLQYI